MVKRGEKIQGEADVHVSYARLLTEVISPNRVLWAFLHDTVHLHPYMVDHISSREQQFLEGYCIEMPIFSSS